MCLRSVSMLILLIGTLTKRVMFNGGGDDESK